MSKSKSRNMSHATPAAAGSSSKRSSTRVQSIMSLHQSVPDKNNNTCGGKASSKKTKDYEKYSLRPRSIQNRIETEKRQKADMKKEPKPKQKPPPLSKYRRRTANARERFRMSEINNAYQNLTSAIPKFPVLPTNAQGKTCEKLTKITTLKLAMQYIVSLKAMLNKPAGGTPSLYANGSVNNNLNDIESDNESIGNSIASISSFCSSSNSVGSGSEFSPSPSYTMSPMPMAGSPECIQTVMRSVVSPAAAAAITANATNLNNLNLSNVSLSSSPGAPLGITTIVTIPSHPHAQAHYSRQIPPTVHQHHLQNQQQSQQILHHHNTLPPPPRPSLAVTTSSSTYMTPHATIQPQQKHILHNQIHVASLPTPITSSVVSSPSSISPSHQNPLLCSQQQAIRVSSGSNFNGNMNNATAQATADNNKMKLPPIATTLSSALLRKSMSSFTDYVQLTNGVSVSMNSIIGFDNNNSININNNANRTGSLSSLTESDLSEYTNDLLSDEGSVLDEPMFDDIIGVGATDLDLSVLLGAESLGFTADLSAI